MRYTKRNIENKLYEMDSNVDRILNKIRHILAVLFLMFFICISVLSFSLASGVFRGILDSAPDISTVRLAPTKYASRTYDRNGNPVATLVTEGSNRERADFSDLPESLINAFVAIEDERFWSHNGIDPKSIIRAVKGVVSNSSGTGGGSTITQQLIKNNVFEGGLNEGKFEKYVRKLQEQYLALLIENKEGIDKRSMKEGIITEYLNTINLGNNTLGVKVASRRYFGKEVNELNLSESAVIAAITKNPSKLNPITHPENNAIRRRQILKNMLEQGYIDENEYNEALADDVYRRIKDVDIRLSESGKARPYSYYTDALIDQVVDCFVERLGYTKEKAYELIYAGGLKIYTCQDQNLQKIVDDEVNNPENYDTAKYDLSWRFTIRHKDGTTVNLSERDLYKYMNSKLGMNFRGLFKSKEDATLYINNFKEYYLEDDDVILGEKIDFDLEPQCSFILMDPHTGEVLALNGGRGEKRYSRSLNRATGTLRQPGSTFKPITSFAPAIDRYGKTLASVFYDEEYTLGDKTFRNWYKSGFLGYQSIRDGIVYSLNIVAVRCMMEALSPEKGAEYAKELGISTLVEEDLNPALALGGITNGVSNLEMTQAYSVMANGGKLNKARLFNKIEDQYGNIIIDLTKDEGKQVMKETSAFLLTDALADSMKANHAYAGSGINVNSTSTRASFPGMSLAGKSGTTSNNKDVWFIGYSPYYVGGIWAGCDHNQSLKDSRTGEYNGGTRYHKNIWRKIMSRVHEGLEDPGFTMPSNIVKCSICRKSGLKPLSICTMDPRGSTVRMEYFEDGTQPTEYCDKHIATEHGVIIKVPKNSSYTDDKAISYIRPKEVEESEPEDEINTHGPGDDTNELIIREEAGPTG